MSTEYKILIFYRTGSSDHTYDDEGYLDGTWKNIEIIKENLQRIKEHYLWYESIYITGSRHNKKIEKPHWYTNKYDGSIKLKLDDGTEYEMSAFWCGYFETLYGAKAEPVKENDNLEITIR